MKVALLIVSVPWFSMAPPDGAELLEKVMLLTVNVPVFTMAPPLPLLSPFSMLRLVNTACTPLSTWKKGLPSAALMVRGMPGLLPSMVMVPVPAPPSSSTPCRRH